MADNIYNNFTPNPKSSSPTPPDTIEQIIEKIKAVKKAKDELIADISKARTVVSPMWIMFMISQVADAYGQEGGLSTMGVSNALLGTWHNSSQEVSNLSNTIPLSKNAQISPTDANGTPLYEGGLKVQSINPDGTLSCLDKNNSVVNFNPVTTDGQGNVIMVPGVPIFNLSGDLFTGIDFVSDPGAGDVDPSTNNPYSGSRTFVPRGSAGQVNLASNMLKAGYTGTKKVQTDLLNTITEMRKSGGVVEQLQNLGIDVTSLESVLNDFDNQLAGMTNVPFTFGAAASMYSGVTQSVATNCQGVKNSFTSTKDTAEAAYRSSATQFQMSFNNVNSKVSGAFSSLGAMMAAIFAEMKNTNSNTRG
ncbi:MAG: hypothetical protein ACOYK9_05680 [Chlamydiia bacterium]